MLIALMLGAAVASAPAPSDARAPAASPPQAAAPAAPSNDDVTVLGRKAKCGERDQKCIQAVIAEIWTRYPEQVRKWCASERVRVIHQGMLEQDLIPDRPAGYGLPPMEAKLCQEPKAAPAP